MCEDYKPISVPQFFWVNFLVDDPDNSFLNDLERVGLQRRAPNADQLATNNAILAAVKAEVLRTARFAFRGVNVRFVEENPASSVGSANTTQIDVGGLNPLAQSRTAYGETSPPDSPYPNPDVGNFVASQYILVQSRWFAPNRERKVTTSPLYSKIFGTLAVENAYGTPLNGDAVEPSHYDPTPQTPRQWIVHAAIIAFGRLVGSTIAHECGHALGLDHTFEDTAIQRRAPKQRNELMDDGVFSSFYDYTGIRAFDASKSQLLYNDPLKFLPVKLEYLKTLLPLFR